MSKFSLKTFLTSQPEKPFTKQWYKVYGKVILGSFLFALSDFLFIVPYGFAPGGVYGLMSVLNNLFSTPMSYVVLMDVPLFLIGLWFLGSSFGIKTLVSILFTWVFTTLMETVFYIPQFGYVPLIHSGNFLSVENFTCLATQIQEDYVPVRGLGGVVISYFKPDYMLNAITAGLAYGVSCALTFSSGATTGGSDVISMILHKYLHLPLGTMVMIVDSIIALTSFAIGGDIRLPIYSILLIYVESIVINNIVDTKVNRTMLIVTEHIEQVRQLIVDQMDRSGTVFVGKGLYQGRERQMIYTTVNRKEYIKIKYSIKKMDPHCFITIISNTETLGEGFDELPDK